MIAIAAIIVVAAVLLLLFFTGVLGQEARAAFVVDDKATDTAELTPDNAQEQLQKAVDESMFSFRINSNMIFENAQAEGEMVIECPAHNRYGMKVELILEEENEKIYATDILPPGSGIVRDRLDVPLAAGEYDAIAMIYAYDMETQELMGQNAAAVKVTVEG